VRLAYAKALMDAKRVDDAQKQLEQAVRDDAKFADGWLLLGETQLMRKQFDAAEKSLQAYLQNADQPGPAGGTPRGVNAAALSLADLALRANRPDDARAALAKVSDQDATVGQQLRHAKLLADLGDEAAGAALLASLPDGTADERKEKVLATSQYLRETGHANRAYAMLRKLLAQRPTDTDVLYDTALAAEKAGDPATMERHLRRIIELEPKNYNAYNALGYSLADRNERLDEARQLIGKALELSPDSPHILDSMGWLEYRQGHLDKALALLQKAYAEFPDAEVAAHLGEVLWVRGDKAKAEAVWHEALQSDPKNDILLETLKRLRK
jgi:tetratricopeptide (TPR) repeat protein